MNELSHFMTKIEVNDFEELDIHFVHQKSNVKGAVPLLFVHGCNSINFVLALRV
jgi:hypothetical protein